MKIRRALAVPFFSALLASPTLAQTPDWQTCTFKRPITEVQLLKDIPKQILAWLPQPFGEKNAVFAGDVIIIENGVRISPIARLVRAGFRGKRWFVWLLADSMIRQPPVTTAYIFDVSGAAPVKTAENPVKWGDDLCASTDAMLDTP